MIRRPVAAILGAAVLLLAACGTAATSTSVAPLATATPTTASKSTPLPGPTATPTPKPAATPTPPSQAQPRYGGTLRARQRLEPSTWDPARYHGAEEHRPLTLIYDRLVEFKYGPPICNLYPLAPALATDWRWVDDTTLEVKLRSGVHFQDGAATKGREVTANDVVYSFKRSFATLAFYKPLADVTESVRAVDSSTARFTLRSPFADYVLQALAAVQSEIVAPEPAGAGDAWAWENHLGAGNGPFVLLRSIPGVKIELEKNARYYRPGLPYVNAVTLYVMREESTVLAALRSNRLDVAQFDSTQVGGEAESVPSLRTQACGYTASNVIFMRTDQPPLDDVRVRRALSMAIDREAYLKTALAGRGVPRWSPIHTDFGDWALPMDQYPASSRQYLSYNPEAAKDLLKQSGHGTGFDTNTVIDISIGGRLQAAEAVSAMFAKVGVRVKLQTMDPGLYNSLVVTKRQYDGMVLRYASSNTLDEAVYTYFKSDATRNYSWVSDPRLDAMLEAQRRTIDEKARRRIINEIQVYLADQQYRLELPESLITLAMQTAVRNVSYKTNGWVDAEFYRFAWLESNVSN